MGAVPGTGPFRPQSSGGQTRVLGWTWAALLVAATLAWGLTVGQSWRMGVGLGTMGLALPVFLVMWVPMMAAMMFPALAPVVILWGRSINRVETGTRRVVRQGSFVVGYIVVWTVYGLVAFGLLLGAERLVGQSPGAARWIGAGAYLAAGLYQLTPLKRVCLRHCRSPLGQFLRFGSLRGPGIDFRVGLLHGGYCVGCCWALMLILVGVGVMNLVAMVALTALIFLEKVWRHGNALAWAASAVFVVLAILTLFHPGLIPGLSTRVPAADMTPGM
ncbi:DUF2182 domain-containing protein [Saccharopolyspora sp. ASAGF58]|nr:DUF2182 domain-containing protein [Saccharopolyspora sp. ASAGF58]